jgi:hypothetical protein
VPALDLAMVVGSIAILAWLGGRQGAAAALVAACVVVGLAALRALTKVDVARITPRVAGQVLVVATVHDVGRALALVVRAGHATRRVAPAGSS